MINIAKFILLSIFIVALVNISDFRNSSLSLFKYIDSNEELKIEELYEKYDNLLNKGQYYEAIPLAKSNLEFIKKQYGKDSFEYTFGLNRLAILYNDLDYYDKALDLYAKILILIQNLHKYEHHDEATCLHNMAGIHLRIGNYDKALFLYKKALEINKNLFGPENLKVATNLNKIAIIYQLIGEYSKAFSFFQKSIDIMENKLSSESFDLAIVLNDIAGFYQILGDYERALIFQKRALGIVEKLFGPEHRSYAALIDNLGSIYLDLGDYKLAFELHMKAYVITQNMMGQYHPELAYNLNNIARVFELMNDYEMAVIMQKQALSILKKNFEPKSPHIATGLDNLARVLVAKGSYDEALQLFEKSLSIHQSYPEKKDLNVTSSFFNVAYAYLFQDNFDQAIENFFTASNLSESIFNQVMSFSTEQQKMNFLNQFNFDLSVLLSLVVFNADVDERLIVNALDLWIRRKGIVMESQRSFNRSLFKSNEIETQKVFQELAKIRSQISRLYFTPQSDKKDSDLLKAKIENLEDHKKNIESNLRTLSQPYNRMQTILENARVSSIAKHLPKNSVLIEFAKVPKVEIPVSRQIPLVYHYVAFIIFENANVKAIDLGNADNIDILIEQFRNELSASKFDIELIFSLSIKLHNIVFLPIRNAIGDALELFVSLDGNLNLIPFEVLQDDQGRFLIEDYVFNYLYSGRQIIGFGPSIEEGGKVLIMGDPDFELSQVGIREDPEIDELRSVSMELRVFRPLPGTREEIHEISQIIGLDNSLVFTGAEATEENLFAHDNPSILHLATHGFFQEDKPTHDVTHLPTSRSFSFMPHDQFQAQGKFLITDNPLLRSGLILAGANQTIRGEAGSDQGIVTAEKILNLRLWGTDLVVLSACDTGIGDVRTGEGVFGLRRAFNQVGAKSLVMSMWKVPDKETTELMVNFYRNIYEENLDYNQALRKASRAQLEITRERYGHGNPFYWGGFIFSGESRKSHIFLPALE